MGMNIETIAIGFLFGLGFSGAQVLVNALVGLIKKM